MSRYVKRGAHVDLLRYLPHVFARDRLFILHTLFHIHYILAYAITCLLPLIRAMPSLMLMPFAAFAMLRATIAAILIIEAMPPCDKIIVCDELRQTTRYAD